MSRLMSRVLAQRWGDTADRITLLDDAHAHESMTSSTARRFLFGMRLANRQITGRCDWVFYTHLSIARVQLFVPAEFRRPYAVFIHGIEAWRTLTRAQKRVLRGACLRVANSAFTARRVAAMHPDIGPVVSCPLALQPDGLASDDAGATPLDIGSRAVILVARMSASERYKGHDELLAAWPDVIARVPGARLVFVGDGDDLPRLRKKAGALGLGDTVIQSGFVPQNELAALYRHAAVFAMPSRGEGFGLVYLEAMSRRLPCIGALEDAASEIIEDGVTGFLIRQADRETLVTRIVTLLTDEALRARMGDRGLRRAAELFSYDRFSARMLSLIDDAFPERAADRLAAARSVQ